MFGGGVQLHHGCAGGLQEHGCVGGRDVWCRSMAVLGRGCVDDQLGHGWARDGEGYVLLEQVNVGVCNCVLLGGSG